MEPRKDACACSTVARAVDGANDLVFIFHTLAQEIPEFLMKSMRDICERYCERILARGTAGPITVADTKDDGKVHAVIISEDGLRPRFALMQLTCVGAEGATAVELLDEGGVRWVYDKEQQRYRARAATLAALGSTLPRRLQNLAPDQICLMHILAALRGGHAVGLHAENALSDALLDWCDSADAHLAGLGLPQLQMRVDCPSFADFAEKNEVRAQLTLAIMRDDIIKHAQMECSLRARGDEVVFFLIDGDRTLKATWDPSLEVYRTDEDHIFHIIHCRIMP